MRQPTKLNKVNNQPKQLGNPYWLFSKEDFKRGGTAPSGKPTFNTQ